MPKTAALADRIAVLRSVVTTDNAHSSSGYAMLTGQPHQPLNFENANPGAPNDWPTMGAVIQYLPQGQRELPPSIRLPHHIFNTDQSVWPGQDSGFLGPAADPWLFRCEPASPDAAVPDFQLPEEVPVARFNARRSLLEQLDSRLTQLDKNPNFEQLYQQNQQAFNLLTSSRSFQACDLTRESTQTRDRYGRHQFGQNQSHYEKSYFDKQHDHIIMTDTGEVIEFCDPRIQSIKKTIEEIFGIEIHNHSLYLYGQKKQVAAEKE